MCACVCAYMPTNEREPVGERRGREGSVGITTGGSGGGRDGGQELCATINHLLGVRVYLE